jgi:uncharacterized protein (DUF58 family)
MSPRGRLPRLAAALAALTPTGRWGLAAGISCLAVGAALDWREFVQIGVLALVLVAGGLGWVLLPGSLRAELVVRPTRITHGRPAVVTLEVRNGAVPRFAPTVTLAWAGEEVTAHLGRLRPGARTSVEVALPPRGRGVWTVGPVREERRDLLGLARRVLDIGGRDHLWIRPRTVPLDMLTSGLYADLEGLASQQVSMSDLSFHALREYQPGDDLRHVHWRSSAKADQLLVRQYHESRRGHVTVLLDHEPAAYARDDEFELAVSVAASFALRAVADGWQGHLRCGRDEIVPQSPAEVLDLACRFRRSEGSFAAVIEQAARTAATGLVVLVTGSLRAGPELRAAAARLEPEVDRLLVRAHPAGEPSVVRGRGTRQVTVSALEQLPGTVLRGTS